MRDMARAPSFSLIVSSLLLPIYAAGCGASSEPPPQSPPPAPLPASEAPSSKAAAPAATGTEDAWEGEAEAKNGTAPAEGGKGGAETRTNEVIAKVIKDNRKPFRDCFEAAAKELPELEGTMTIHFVLDPDGKVKSGELNGARSTIQAASVVNCAINVLKQMKFPPSSRGMESVVNYPFDFKR
jgi:hypothetical protein